MSEWHLRCARPLLKKARESIGGISLSGDGFDGEIMDLLNAIDGLIAAIGRKLDDKTRRPSPCPSTASNQVEWKGTTHSPWLTTLLSRAEPRNHREEHT
jgi:hypothetical protein